MHRNTSGVMELVSTALTRVKTTNAAYRSSKYIPSDTNLRGFRFELFKLERAVTCLNAIALFVFKVMSLLFNLRLFPEKFFASKIYLNLFKLLTNASIRG